MTYKQIEALILDRIGESTRDALRRCVVDESDALLRGTLAGRKRPTARMRVAAVADAEAYYAEDITAAFNNVLVVSRRCVPLAPEQILNLRRAPYAWAFAELLRRAGVEGL